MYEGSWENFLQKSNVLYFSVSSYAYTFPTTVLQFVEIIAPRESNLANTNNFWSNLSNRASRAIRATCGHVATQKKFKLQIKYSERRQIDVT